jgi:hypothetical protein
MVSCLEVIRTKDEASENEELDLCDERAEEFMRWIE